MKVGVDGVLIGSWASATGKRILDAGTGCGVIALMLAQRIPDAEIIAIDIDKSSIGEASENFENSRWNERIRSLNISFKELQNCEHESFDLIVSNPPFFESGVKHPTTVREIARHQGEFSPSALVEGASGLLRTNGKLAMIVPSEYYDSLCEIGIACGLYPYRASFVKNKPTSQIKRVMLEFIKDCQIHNESDASIREMSVLTMFDNNGYPTPEYVGLGRDFYLKF